MNINVAIRIDDLVGGVLESATRSEVANLIIRLDASAADVGFTEGIVRRLVASLRNDYESPADFQAFLRQLGATP